MNYYQLLTAKIHTLSFLERRQLMKEGLLDVRGNLTFLGRYRIQCLNALPGVVNNELIQTLYGRSRVNSRNL